LLLEPGQISEPLLLLSQQLLRRRPLRLVTARLQQAMEALDICPRQVFLVRIGPLARIMLCGPGRDNARENPPW